MKKLEATDLIQTYEATGLSLFRFWFNWFALALLAISAANFAINGAPAGMGKVQYYIFCALIPILGTVSVWNNWTMARKICVDENGLRFYTLTGNTFVSWDSVSKFATKRLGSQTLHTVNCRDGKQFKFMSGITREAELIEHIQSHTSAFLNQAK